MASGGVRLATTIRAADTAVRTNLALIFVKVDFYQIVASAWTDKSGFGNYGRCGGRPLGS